MRQGQQNSKRMRGRNRGGGGKGPNPLTRSYESNGPDVKIRGTALHIAEKYVQLARDAQSSGDRVAAESYFQHAEHYYRLVAAAQAQMPQPQPIYRSDEDDGDDDDRAHGGNGNGDRMQPRQAAEPYGVPDSQPYVNGGGNGQAKPDEDAAPAQAAPQGDDNGGDQRPRDDGRAGYRSRRRRPYRERFGGEGGEGGETQAAPAAADPPGEAASSEE